MIPNTACNKTINNDIMLMFLYCKPQSNLIVQLDLTKCHWTQFKTSIKFLKVE